jgi:hypothetical protein
MREWEHRKTLPFSHIGQADYVQVITPLVMAQVLAVKECVAVAFHPGGGPATVTATMVTFWDGVNPWRGAGIVAVPPKYAPPASAEYCSS